MQRLGPNFNALDSRFSRGGRVCGNFLLPSGEGELKVPGSRKRKGQIVGLPPSRLSGIGANPEARRCAAG